MSINKDVSVIDISWLIQAGSFCPIKLTHKSYNFNDIDVEELEPVNGRTDHLETPYINLKKLNGIKYIAEIISEDYTHAMIVHNFMRDFGAKTNLFYNDAYSKKPYRWFVTANKIPDELNHPDNHGVNDEAIIAGLKKKGLINKAVKLKAVN